MTAVIPAIISVVAIAIVTIDNIRLRREVKQLKAEAAEIVSNALGNSVLVDGVELPKPDDERWKIRKQDEARFLFIGDVWITEIGIWAGDLTPYMSPTGATKNYCSAVWREYRSRVARKAIETST